MKTLQNNFTTPEQSKRLLELGVPADSADCYYSHYIKTYAHSEYIEILWHRPRFITKDNKPSWNARLMDGTQIYLHCWSVGRLMAIYFISKGLDYWSPQFKKYQIENSAEYFVALIEENIKELDFSKLEE